MNESKIDLTNRLKKEGRWEEASLWKDKKIRKLRGASKKRPEAQALAWGEMAREFPPIEIPREEDVHLPSGSLKNFLEDATWAHKSQLEDPDVGPAPSDRALGLLAWLQENEWSHDPEMAEDRAVIALKESLGFEEEDWLDFAAYLRRLIVDRALVSRPSSPLLPTHRGPS